MWSGLTKKGKKCRLFFGSCEDHKCSLCQAVAGLQCWCELPAVLWHLPTSPGRVRGSCRHNGSAAGSWRKTEHQRGIWHHTNLLSSSLWPDRVSETLAGKSENYRQVDCAWLQWLWSTGAYCIVRTSWQEEGNLVFCRMKDVLFWFDIHFIEHCYIAS